MLEEENLEKVIIECFNLDKVLVAGKPLGHCRAQHPQGHHVGQTEILIFRCASISISKQEIYASASKKVRHRSVTNMSREIQKS